MKLKVCGMKYKDNINLISKLNPDYMGFIFYKKSKRFFENEPMPRLNKTIKKVGVFVNPEIEYLNLIVKKHNLDFVQLHGDGKKGLCRIWRAAADGPGCGRPWPDRTQHLRIVCKPSRCCHHHLLSTKN